MAAGTVQTGWRAVGGLRCTVRRCAARRCAASVWAPINLCCVPPPALLRTRHHVNETDGSFASAATALLLCQVGAALLDLYGGLAANLVRAAGQSAVQLVRLVTAAFPGFRDHCVYRWVQLLLAAVLRCAVMC